MNELDLTEAIETLKNGGIILFPTDTIWGLGCDSTNEEACQKMNELKKRPSKKSYVLLADSFNMVEKFVPKFPEICYELVDVASSPLTIIYPTSKDLAKSVVAEDGSVAIRITKDPVCLKLIRALRKPIVATSANFSGVPHPKKFDQMDAELVNSVDTVVAHRQTETLATPSQIIKIGLDSSVKVIRK